MICGTVSNGIISRKFYHWCDVQLNIKSAEVCEMATRLATLTGKSVTRAVGDALRRELTAVDRERDVQRRLIELHRILAEVPSNRRARPMTTEEADAWMYDERGLPH